MHCRTGTRRCHLDTSAVRSDLFNVKGLLANFDDHGWDRQIGEMNLLSHLLPDRSHVRLETWNLDPVRSAITLTLQARRITARCPLCDKRSKRVHSRYERTLADLPWGAYAVTVRLRVRRLFCRNARCERRIFAERLPEIALPWARRTQRLDDRLTALGLVLGGRAGVRLGPKFGLIPTRNTLLRRVRQPPVPPAVTPSVEGGQNSGHSAATKCRLRAPMVSKAKRL